MSSVYLAATKDRLYCDAADARRRRTQTVMWDIADGLCRLLAPILCHTADEAWRALHAWRRTTPATACTSRSSCPSSAVDTADAGLGR
jgi:isoleucyl-tRNA synthetase